MLYFNSSCITTCKLTFAESYMYVGHSEILYPLGTGGTYMSRFKNLHITNANHWREFTLVLYINIETLSIFHFDFLTKRHYYWTYHDFQFCWKHMILEASGKCRNGHVTSYFGPNMWKHVHIQDTKGKSGDTNIFVYRSIFVHGTYVSHSPQRVKRPEQMYTVSTSI